MNFIKIMILAALISSSLLLAACGDSENKDVQNIKQQTSEAVQAVQEYASSKQDEISAQFQTQLDALSNDVTGLKQETQALGADAQNATRKQLDALEQDMGAFKEKLAQAKQAGAENWDQALVELGQSWEKVQEQYQKLKEYIHGQTK